MADDTPKKTEATVLVKKPDGSMVRVPLSQLVKHKKSSKKKEEQTVVSVQKEKKEAVTTKSAPVAKQVVPKKKAVQKKKQIPRELPAQKTITPAQVEQKKEEPVEMKEPKPLPRILRQRTKKTPIQTQTHAWSSQDHASLLTEDVEDHEKHDVGEGKAYNTSMIVDEVMQDMPMSIAPDLQVRTREALTSLIRGTRDTNHFHAFAVRTAGEGGLGLNDEDAARLVVIAHKKRQDHERALKQQHQEQRAPVTKRARAPKVSVQQTEKIDSSLVRKGEQLATTTPVDHYFEDVARAKMEARKKKEEKLILQKQTTVHSQNDVVALSLQKSKAKRQEKGNMQRDIAAQLLKNRKPRAVKNMVKDMQAPAHDSRTMGPVEEMQQFSLVDWRRLSPDPDRATEKFIQKLQGWKEESYLLYIDARNAWFHSPLYAAYQNIITDAVQKGSTIEDHIRRHADKTQMSVKEFLSMVELTKQLTV